MYILRSAVESDLEELYKLSKLITFINLPANKEVLHKKIKLSMNSFQQTAPSKDMSRDYYLFILEDTKTNEIIGASMIHAQHGTEDEPHFYLTVGQEHKFSNTINTGFIHGTLKLGLETNGYTEIGGLILNPDYRGNSLKLGKQISFVRFLFMGLNQNKFTEDIHSELMPPFDKKGNSPLWEAIGRRFLNMNYQEADMLSRDNKEFILSLYPSDTIYEPLLPLEARNAIGKVGDETKPVKKMLESIGFRYMSEVDPFDGGPHYRCPLKEITLVKEMEQYKVEVDESLNEFSQRKMIQVPYEDYPFAACVVPCEQEGNVLKVSSDTFNLYQLDKNQTYAGINF